MYEPRHTPPLSRSAYYRRLAAHGAVALTLMGGSLVAGIAGYHSFERLDWLDAFLNAAMLLGGEGPLESPATPEGKLFAGAYALYSGVVFIVVTGLVLAPVAHRLLHRFHWTDDPAD